MPEIILNDGSVAIIDDADADLTQLNWTAYVGASGMTYAVRTVLQDKLWSRVLLHRLILERINGRALSRRELTDHKDTNSLNNRRSNLRIADHIQNGGNRRLNTNSKTGFKGVNPTGHKDSLKQFSAYCAGKFLGTYPTAEEAHAAYCAAAVDRWGEFANFGVTDHA